MLRPVAPPDDRVAVDRLIIEGDLSAQAIAQKHGVEVNYVRLRALAINAPFSTRRSKSDILADLCQQLEEIHVRFRMQVAADSRTDPIA
jgi:hypothetical protein